MKWSSWFEDLVYRLYDNGKWIGSVTVSSGDEWTAFLRDSDGSFISLGNFDNRSEAMTALEAKYTEGNDGAQ